MKKSFMTRILATGLSFAMAFSMAAVTSVTPASAASKPVLVDAVTGGSGKAVTVNVGEVAKLKIDATTGKTYAVSSVKKSSKKIKTSVSKTGTVVYVRGVSETGEKDSAIRVSFKVKKTGKTSKCTFASKIKVVSPKPAVAEITEAVQKETKKVAVKFSTAVEAVKPTDITVTRVDGNVAIPVKGVVLDTDKAGAMIETYTEMKDGKEYEVKYTAADEAKTVSSVNFTATANKIAKLDASTLNVPANDSSEVKIKTLDANDVLLGSYTFSQLGAQKMTAEFKFSTGGYKDGDKIFLKKAGDTAEIKVKLHTYTYDENNVEKDTVDGSFVVTAVDETYAGYTFGYSVVSTAVEPAWDASSYKQNTVIPAKATYYVYLNIKNAAGSDRTSKFSVSSADKDVALLAAGTAKKGTAMPITGVKDGATYLLVKDEAGNLITSLPITVQPARKATTLRLSKNTVNVSNVTDQAIIGLTAKIYDQYNQEMKIDAGSVVVNELTVAAANQNVATAMVNTGVAIDARRKTKGTYYYEVKAKSDKVEVSTNLTVGVSEPDGTVVTYEIEVDDVDCATDETSSDTAANKFATIKIAQKRGGVLEKYISVASLSAFSIQNTSDATTVGVASDSATVITTTCAAVSGTATTVNGFHDKALYQQVKSGLYKVSATVEKGGTDKAVIEGTFNVKNDQAAKYATAVKVRNMNDYSKTSYTNSVANLYAALGNSDILAIQREGAGIDSSTYDIKNVTYTQASTSDKDVFVESVDVLINIKGTKASASNKILVTLPVGVTFTMK